MSELLKITNVTKKYHHFKALNNVSMTLESGKIIGLLGPNGSGKTTLIKIINGLLKDYEGEVLVDGKNVGIDSRKIISYLPDENYFQDWMYIKDVLSIFSDLYEDFDLEKAEEMIEALNINVDEKIKDMSKGTKEKVQLILVMSRNADVYILDEPIGGVDPAARSFIMRTILQNFSEESTLIIATHLISEIENICDEIIFLSYGEIKLQGNVDEIREEKGKSIDALFREEFRC